MRLSRAFFCLPFVALGWVAAIAGDAPAPGGTKKPASQEQIARLIAELGSEDSDIRAEAARRLGEMDEALPPLRAALKSADAEVRRRAEAIVRLIEVRLTERAIQEAVARVNAEGLDLFIDRMVLKKGYATAAHWKATVEVARALGKRAAKAGAKIPAVLDRDLLALPEAAATDVLQLRPARLRVDGWRRQHLSLHGCVLLSSGSIGPLNSTDHSILFVNGDIESLNSTTNSVIICTGTIKQFNSTQNSIIFCNGTVENMNFTSDNAVFVRGELQSLNFTKGNVIAAGKLGRTNVSQGNIFLNHKANEVGRSQGDTFVAADPSPLDLFRFFDPAVFGLEFKMVDGDAQVEKAAAGKAFARAGLRQGDLILAVDRQKFLAPGPFTQLLRRRVVAGRALLKVQRGDRVLDIDLQFP